jgi:hypothetical protein
MIEDRARAMFWSVSGYRVVQNMFIKHQNHQFDVERIVTNWDEGYRRYRVVQDGGGLVV